MTSKRKRTRMLPAARREIILSCAINLAKNIGYATLTRAKVAKLARVSDALIAYYFKGRDGLKIAVMRHAIKHEILEIMMQGLSVNDSMLRRIKPDLKNKLMDYLKQQ